MKRIIFCFDGTWNNADSDNPTNVLLTASSIAPTDPNGHKQIVHYDTGVGTEMKNKARGGMLGRGLFENIKQAYLFLISNYEPGDEIFVFGFSRGAFTARSFTGFIKAIGIIQRHKVKFISDGIRLYKGRLKSGPLELVDFRARNSRHITVCPEDDEYRCKALDNYTKGQAYPFQIKYVGIWDTVESLGLRKIIKTSLSRKGKKFVAKEYKFHDHTLNDLIAAGRHAVALDEHRKTFDVEPWGDLEKYNQALGFSASAEDAPIQEKFFPGTHGSVGGGGPVRGLSDGALEWVLDGATSRGLHLDTSVTSVIYNTAPDWSANLSNNPEVNEKPSFTTRLMNMGAKPRQHKPSNIYQVHETAKLKWAYPSVKYKPHNLAHLKDELDKTPPTVLKEVKHKAGIIEQTSTSDPYEYYTIKKGDSLSKIAKLRFKDYEKWKLIFKINQDIIINENKIYVGQVIRIPILNETGPN